jgi:hypothetical protein
VTGILGDAGQPLPHLERIQASFGGAHDLSRVHAHVGGAAAGAARAMGAEGFATGDHVGFASQPDLFLAAHEAAHVVQQRDGVSLSDGVGEAGDRYEQHADAVAARVVAGQSAADLLPSGGGRAETGGAGALQLYTTQRIGADRWRISEDGDAMVGQGAANHTLFASDSLIAESNVALASAGERGSFIHLEKATPVDARGKQLYLVIPRMRTKGADPENRQLDAANRAGGRDSEGSTSDDLMALWADCGRSSRAIMGTDDAGLAPHATFTAGGAERSTARGANPGAYSDTIYLTAMPAFLRKPEYHRFLVRGVHYTGDLAGSWSAITGDADRAREQYWRLGDEGRRVFDGFAGINTAADPKVGGAYTMNTEYNMPGSDVVRTAEMKGERLP